MESRAPQAWRREDPYATGLPHALLCVKDEKKRAIRFPSEFPSLVPPLLPLAFLVQPLEVVWGGLSRQVIGLAGQSNLVIVISTLSAAAMFSPLRRRIQNIIDRRFFRRRYDVELTLQRFSSTLRSEVDIGLLSSTMVQVVDETMQPSEVSLWLRRDQHGSGM